MDQGEIHDYLMIKVAVGVVAGIISAEVVSSHPPQQLLEPASSLSTETSSATF